MKCVNNDKLLNLKLLSSRC
uniref:Uncharacterized protein n=1 Tax=Rhizophora mucronata TaxID=61149 RepID=A0A2P2NW97_RHIMU